jgi:hypothetical protein
MSTDPVNLLRDGLDDVLRSDASGVAPTMASPTTSASMSTGTSSMGTPVDTVARSDRAVPWTFGVCALYNNLARRGLLAAAGGQ